MNPEDIIIEPRTPDPVESESTDLRSDSGSKGAPDDGPAKETGEKPRKRRTLLRILVLVAVAGVLLSGVALFGAYMYFTHDLPKLFTVDDYKPPVVTRVFDLQGEVIGEFFTQRRDILPLSRMPQLLIKAFVAAEDDRFFDHPGVDFMGILRAIVRNIQAGRKIQGGSTITQQITRSLLLTPEKSYTRKIKEAILAYRLENRLSKEDILYIYLNEIYLGHGAYGVEAASRVYFDKSAQNLNLAECALLAGLPRAPSRYSPHVNPQKARERQEYVLRRMVEERYVTPAQAREEGDYDRWIRLAPPPADPFLKAPYFTEYVRIYLEKKYGRDLLYEGGLRVYTSLDLRLERAARQAILQGVRDLDKRIGYQGPLENIPKQDREQFCRDLAQTPPGEGGTASGMVTAVDDAKMKVHVCLGSGTGIIDLEDMRWARKPNPDVPSDYGSLKRPSDALKKGDRILVRVLDPVDPSRDPNTPVRLALEQEPEAQAALLCIDLNTGNILSMVGGTDFFKSQFNRALQAQRQPGSAFKSVVYAAALEKGYTPVTVILDSPVVYDDPYRGERWKPNNYEKEFFGPTLLRDALIHSRNVVTVKLLQEIGVDYVIQYARKMGFESDLVPNLSLGLGSSEVNLLELVRAYTIFATKGNLIQPVFVTKVEDRQGGILEENRSERTHVLDEDTAFVMTHLLEEVVQFGTGKKVRDLNRPAAGKTGTTNDLKDAWFIGFTPELIAGVWVGFDDYRPMGRYETGARAASPIWLSFMQEALKGQKIRPFDPPDGVVFAKIDPETGKLATAATHDPVFECFKAGTEPTETMETEKDLPSDFFQSDRWESGG